MMLLLLCGRWPILKQWPVHLMWSCLHSEPNPNNTTTVLSASPLIECGARARCAQLAMRHTPSAFTYAGEWLGHRAHPGGLGVRNARNAPCPKPAVSPAQWRAAGPAQPHRLRSKRDATRRPGAAGGCGAAVLGQRVRGRPVPKGVQELNQLHKCPGLRRNPWQWYEPAGPTGDRHDAHVASMEHVYHRDGASGSHTGARTARRTTGDRKLRAEARCWDLFRGIKNG